MEIAHRADAWKEEGGWGDMDAQTAGDQDPWVTADPATHTFITSRDTSDQGGRSNLDLHPIRGKRWGPTAAGIGWNVGTEFANNVVGGAGAWSEASTLHVADGGGLKITAPKPPGESGWDDAPMADHGKPGDDMGGTGWEAFGPENEGNPYDEMGNVPHRGRHFAMDESWAPPLRRGGGYVGHGNVSGAGFRNRREGNPESPEQYYKHEKASPLAPESGGAGWGDSRPSAPGKICQEKEPSGWDTLGKSFPNKGPYECPEEEDPYERRAQWGVPSDDVSGAGHLRGYGQGSFYNAKDHREGGWEFPGAKMECESGGGLAWDGEPLTGHPLGDEDGWGALDVVGRTEKTVYEDPYIDFPWTRTSHGSPGFTRDGRGPPPGRGQGYTSHGDAYGHGSKDRLEEWNSFGKEQVESTEGPAPCGTDWSNLASDVAKATVPGDKTDGWALVEIPVPKEEEIAGAPSGARHEANPWPPRRPFERPRVEPECRGIDNIVQAMRNILFNLTYDDNAHLSEDDEAAVCAVLAYHPQCTEKMGCGVDYIKINRHHTFQDVRCFWVVRTDATETDFSYHKCLKEKVAKEFPEFVERYDAIYRARRTRGE